MTRTFESPVGKEKTPTLTRWQLRRRRHRALLERLTAAAFAVLLVTVVAYFVFVTRTILPVFVR